MVLRPGSRFCYVGWRRWSLFLFLQICAWSVCVAFAIIVSDVRTPDEVQSKNVFCWQFMHTSPRKFPNISIGFAKPAHLSLLDQARIFSSQLPVRCFCFDHYFIKKTFDFSDFLLGHGHHYLRCSNDRGCSAGAEKRHVPCEYGNTTVSKYLAVLVDIENE